MSYRQQSLVSELQAIVVDLGSGIIKGGFAGDDSPRAVFPTIVGKSKQFNKKYSFYYQQNKEYYIGDEALSNRSILDLTSPIDRGLIINWEDLTKVLHYTFYNELSIAPEEHPILFSEIPLNPKLNKEKMTELIFEIFRSPGLFMENQACLSLYANGRTSGIVLESGDGISHIVPIYDGFSLPHATRRLDLGGKDLTNYLMKLLSKSFPTIINNHLTWTCREIVRDIKEKLCNCSLDLKKQEELKQSYELPDGNIIMIGKERFECIEALFKPSLCGIGSEGLHELIFNSITSCDIDIHNDLYNNIILSGGTTMFVGLEERLKKEITKLANRSVVKLIAPPERKCTTWIGGSILGCLTPFQTMWITKEEYDECGGVVSVRKCF